MEKTIGQHFMQLTQYKYLDASGKEQGIPQPRLQLEYDNTLPLIDLPDPETFPEINLNLLEFIELRTSTRQFSGRKVTLPELSYLLWCTQGVKGIMGDKATFRTVPSAGACHAFETYLLVNNVEDLEPGLYRFLALEHKLLPVKLTKEISDEIFAACLKQPSIKLSAVTFIWTAVTERMTWKYGDRGYRYLHLDAGHVCQNLYLTSESIGCGTCAIAAFDDEALNNALGIDGQSHFAIYCAVVGKK
ncbi:MAG: SagB/ThcOx family dehydrogenase [Veillonellaceae bacterium]|jgi:SagB-type dehydrogenase family enzyme|nr:SagB/ThcOx family dehydrogenase [Veillonellaceae bacterium]